MKTKVNVLNEIENLVKRMNENGNDGTFFCIYQNDKSNELGISMSVDDDNELTSTLAALIATAYSGKGEKDEGMQRAAKAIVRAVGLVVSAPQLNEAGIRVKLEIIKMLLENDIDTDNDDDEDDREDCEHCENNRDCPLPDAIAYRKANGIRKPKNKKKGGRKVDVN